MKKNFKQLSQKEIALFIHQLRQKPFRVKQIIHWIYGKLASSFNEMTDLPKELREELNKTAFISNLHLLQTRVSGDGTHKFLFELEDGETIESVLMPNTLGDGKFTLCISSQAGCAMGCAFCTTGKLGFKRNLKAYEIVDQVISVERSFLIPSPVAGGGKGEDDSQQKITNIVFMGMGEPLNNFNEVAEALWKITGLMGFSKRRITISTAGIIPKIYELAEKAPDINLAISLNATTDEIRNKIMPVNKKYPFKKLLKACKEFPLPPRRFITFEYVLIDGTNDTEEDAARLVKLLKGIRSKVNLIPYNPPLQEKSQVYRQPSENRILEFQKILHNAGITVLIRKSMGADISAACGQLKAAYSS
ncbi:MAG: 23S rRNA (adenine(2503)-C(2))-methyltransferase RlmN [Nitrospirae bacterium]|nr:23S rRNA (adenine(2503)-C(2))-methyltransferase RlmN [Nitrospirota bacterium]